MPSAEHKRGAIRPTAFSWSDGCRKTQSTKLRYPLSGYASVEAELYSGLKSRNQGPKMPKNKPNGMYVFRTFRDRKPRTKNRELKTKN
jgi:hypothetical protein